ncbi:MAG: hypothetical protein IJ493_12145 [Clostridia bacterium]|nr:hypothetical protein [Clostridia bacterium]
MKAVVSDESLCTGLACGGDRLCCILLSVQTNAKELHKLTMENFDLSGIVGAFMGFIGGASVISGLLLRRFDKLERKLDRREADRVRESVMQGETLDAVGRLCEANTLGLRTLTTDAACSGELNAYRQASSRLERFLREKSAEYLHSR